MSQFDPVTTSAAEFADWPDPALVVGEKAVDFSLVYRGSLPACQPKDGKAAAKQKIRLEFSNQLNKLWQEESVLRETIGNQGFAPAILEDRRIKLEHPHLGQKYAHARVEAFGYRILPLVTCFGGLVCHLTIEFLRRDEPGGVFNAGDIDNRLKTLLDASRMPQSAEEVPTVGAGEELYCLMEDDSLVTKVTIDTQRLRTQLASGEPPDYAELLVKVATKIQRPHAATRSGY